MEHSSEVRLRQIERWSGKHPRWRWVRTTLKLPDRDNESGLAFMREWQKTCTICKQPATQMTKFGLSRRRHDGSYRTSWVELPTCKEDDRMLKRLQGCESFGLRMAALSLLAFALGLLAYFLTGQTLWLVPSILSVVLFGLSCWVAVRASRQLKPIRDRFN